MSSNNNIKTHGVAVIGAIVIGFIVGAIVQSVWVGLIAAAILMWVFLKASNSGVDVIDDLTNEDSEQITISANIPFEFRPDGTGESTLTATEYSCAIAGAKYRNNSEFGFIGYVKPDPNNAYDKRAIGIYRLDGGLVGYVPKDEQSDLRSWSNRVVLPCVGIIHEGYNGSLRGRVKVIDADRLTTEIHIIKYVLWIAKNHGRAYIPREYKQNTQFHGLTSDAWIEHLIDVYEAKDEERKTRAKEKRQRIKKAKAAIATYQEKGE